MRSGSRPCTGTASVADLEDAHIHRLPRPDRHGRLEEALADEVRGLGTGELDRLHLGRQVVEDLAHLAVLEVTARSAQREPRLGRRGSPRGLGLELGEDALGTAEVVGDGAREHVVDQQELRGSLLGDERPHAPQVGLVGRTGAQQRGPVGADGAGQRPRHQQPGDHVCALDRTPQVHEQPGVVARGRGTREPPDDRGSLADPLEVGVRSTRPREREPSCCQVVLRDSQTSVEMTSRARRAFSRAEVSVPAIEDAVRRRRPGSRAPARGVTSPS